MQNLPIKQLIKDFFKHFEIRHKNDRMESLQFCHKDKHKNHEIKIKIILEQAYRSDTISSQANMPVKLNNN